eukprot:227959_1
MALLVRETNQPTEGDEVLLYLQNQKVPLNDDQIQIINEMQLSLEDLSNMSIESDFVEFCKELKLSFAPKMKLKSAIIKWQKTKTNISLSHLENINLQLLISMGFNEDNAKRALTNNDNDINKAVNALKSLN